MSDSDDTDILLLIPPDYFITAAQEKLQLEERAQRQQKQLQRHLDAFEKRRLKPYDRKQLLLENSINKNNGMHRNVDALPEPEPATEAYKFLPPNKKAELNLINARLQSIESTQDKEHEHDFNERFAMASDISTISTCTVRSQALLKKSQQPRIRNGVIVHHSTPKGRRTSGERLSGGYDEHEHIEADEEGVLLEIDNFLEDRHHYNKRDLNNWNRHSDEYYTSKANEIVGGVSELEAKSLPNTLNRFANEPTIVDTNATANKQQQVHFEATSSCQQYPQSAIGGAAIAPTTTTSMKDHQNLISLSEIWSKSGQNTAIANPAAVSAAAGGCSSTSMSLREEQLRRQHLERMVHSLQTRLLEYQQRISVAIEVDKQKDAILKSNQTEHGIYENEIARLRESLGKYEHEQRELHMQKDLLQRELAQAVSLATKFEDKNEKLEAELNAASRKTNECTSMYKAQIDELEIKMHGYKRSEEFAINELSKLKDKLAKTEYQAEKLKIRNEEMEKENNTLKHQKELWQDFHQKLKTRTDGLETQRKSLQESLAQLTENEMSLKKKMEAQQKTLKMHYQQQLENVVAKKLKEFQDQLDKTEETLKSEARERERLIAERAVKQLELINEKNELEHNLIQEKHNEEVELYRIQLANASKKIDDLEAKLQNYKSKRADLAERLHNVMETQWQQALEILTSPNLKFKSSSNSEADVSPDINNQDVDDEEVDVAVQRHSSHFETPKTSKLRKNCLKQNNLNAASEATTDAGAHKTNEVEPVDRLQAYIELLLSKSPSEMDKLDEILALTRKSKSVNGKLEKTSKRNINCNVKPPWKA